MFSYAISFIVKATLRESLQHEVNISHLCQLGKSCFTASMGEKKKLATEWAKLYNPCERHGELLKYQWNWFQRMKGFGEIRSDCLKSYRCRKSLVCKCLNCWIRCACFILPCLHRWLCFINEVYKEQCFAGAHLAVIELAILGGGSGHCIAVSAFSHACRGFHILH